VKKSRGSNPRRPTQAQSIKRQQEIVAEHDIERLTFAEIARKHGTGEKEVREAYWRYVREIAPLIAGAAPDERALEYLRELEIVRQRLWKIAEGADNDSARVGALREVVKTTGKEVELLQHLGLMPRNLGDLRRIAEERWMAQQFFRLLKHLDAPPKAFSELEAILSGEGEGS
jgi:hypothetical protein